METPRRVYGSCMAETSFAGLSRDYYLIEKAIHFLEESFLDQPDLAAVAARLNMSKYHFHRLFKRWAGITPLQFQETLTLAYAKGKLAEGRSVLDATLDAGLSSPGRLHDLFVSLEAVTPGEYKRRGAGLHIEYGCLPTPFGKALLGVTPRGICHLSFHGADTETAPPELLRRAWPAAELTENRAAAAALLETIFRPAGWDRRRPFHLYLRGTNFQVRVWQALLAIPAGALVSYADLAAYIGSPRALRAVGSAVGANPVAFLIPCHRVISAGGKIHRYRWGAERKRLILAREASGSLSETA
jgi:AraC family transcriptional regulator of adaptative response/methylated-DNA-[protein]-cysteine methyltransferase